jgi:hypothetical protein
MRLFHTQASGRRWKNHIHSLEHEGYTLTAEEDKAEVMFQFFDGLMGMPKTRANSIILEELDLSWLQLNELVGAHGKGRWGRGTHGRRSPWSCSSRFDAGLDGGEGWGQ